MDNKDWFWTLMTPFFAFLLIIVVMHYTESKSQVVAYDCSLAEISPDYPLVVKDKCRKLRSIK